MYKNWRTESGLWGMIVGRGKVLSGRGLEYRAASCWALVGPRGLRGVLFFGGDGLAGVVSTDGAWSVVVECGFNGVAGPLTLALMVALTGAPLSAFAFVDSTSWEISCIGLPFPASILDMMER